MPAPRSARCICRRTHAWGVWPVKCCARGLVGGWVNKNGVLAAPKGVAAGWLGPDACQAHWAGGESLPLPNGWPAHLLP